jgi:gas vesicle protein GvpN
VTTVLKVSPRQFVNTPAIERISLRALRYLQSGFSVHLQGPAGTGKTTLALHLADLLNRPMMLMFGDDEFKSTDLVGNESGYTRKKVVDNYIHSVVKVEDELRHNWVDSRLTLACREGFTLIYDEFNRSRPEVNNILLSILEEKLMVLPPTSNRSEYLRVNPNFRAIFTSNPEEYSGVHSTQDALMDRLITIRVPEPDELTQQEIAVHKTGLDRDHALTIVRLVRAFRTRAKSENSSGLRSALMVAKICQEHGINVMTEDAEFREICQDIMLSRTNLPWEDATRILWELFNEMVLPSTFTIATAVPPVVSTAIATAKGSGAIAASPQAAVEPATVHNSSVAILAPEVAEVAEAAEAAEVEELEVIEPEAIADSTTTSGPERTEVPHEAEVYQFLQTNQKARARDIASALKIPRSQVINALQSLTDQGLLVIRNSQPQSASYQLRQTNAAEEN